ncbi:MAG: hypothetical protein WCJ64_26170 [Rhodospirillaceae bacterium]
MMKSKSKARIGLAAACLAFALVPAHRALAGEWLADKKSGCKVWDGIPEPGESISWDGPCENGFASGSGTLLWFKDGKANGSYIGERAGGKAQGHGINTWLSGDRYEGNWKDDAPSGKGTYTWANGSGYQGEWREGKKQGKAVYIWPNGDRFEGLYQDDRPVSGMYIKADGARYVAEITDGTIGPGNRLYTTEERLSVRRVGTKVCRVGSPVLGVLETKMIGFVENVTDARIQIRIADPGTLIGQTYLGLPIDKNSIIWDDPDNWGPC